LNIRDARDDCTDGDGDGICDDVDRCSASDVGSTIMMEGCDSGAENQLFGDGRTMSDQIGECANGAANHGEFVDCVTRLTNRWRKVKLIRWSEKVNIRNCAAGVNIP
jgi:hypothetical protein